MSLTLGPPALVFGTADLVYAARGGWAPLGWAIGEIATGTVFLGVGALNLATAGFSEPEVDTSSAAIGIVLTALGTVFVAHGILSVVLRDKANRRSTSFTIVPTGGGGFGVASFSF